MTVNGNLTVRNTFLTCGALKMVSNVCREVDEDCWKRDLDKEENVADLEVRETNEERQAMLITI